MFHESKVPRQSGSVGLPLGKTQKSMPARIFKTAFHCLKEALVWLLFLAPGLLIVRYGLAGVINEKLASARPRGQWTSFGDVAVGRGWVFIGVGFWALGEMAYVKTKHGAYRIFGWIFGVGASGMGCWILAQRFLNTGGE